VNWGDDSSTFVFGNPSGQDVTHVYPDGGAGTAYDRHVTVDLYEDFSFHPNFATKDIHVADVAPTLSVFSDSKINQGDFDFLFLYPPVDPGQDTITGFTIDWGDGVVEKFGSDNDPQGPTADPSYFYEFHQYNVANFYEIHVSLTDEDGPHPYTLT